MALVSPDKYKLIMCEFNIFGDFVLMKLFKPTNNLTVQHSDENKVSTNLNPNLTPKLQFELTVVKIPCL